MELILKGGEGKDKEQRSSLSYSGKMVGSEHFIAWEKVLHSLGLKG